MILDILSKTYFNCSYCKIVIILLFLLLLTYQDLFAQQDSTILTQYRRGIELQSGYQSYEQKYAGKNLNEEKRNSFPLESTGIWTELNPKVPRVDYLGVHFINKDTGWACGDLGSLIKTINGGQSWTVSQTSTTLPILKVRSYNSQVVIASGFDGLILRSTDAGENFTQVTSSVTGDMWGLQMLNDTLGWACGNFNSLVKTTDAGQSWQRIFTAGYTSDYWWIEFLNENYGFIAGNGYVLRTTNGGINWDIIPAGDSYPLFSLDVIDSLHIAAAGYGGFNYAAKNLYSSDGGNIWTLGDTLTTEPVNCIQYINPDTGYLVMGEHYYGKTTNRGQVWDYVYTPEMGEFEFQFLLNKNLGYSAGTGLSIYKTQNGYESWQPTIINDNFSDVYFTSENKGFAISSFGNSNPNGLYKTLDGGISWEKVINAPYGTALLFLDSLTGFIGSNQIYKTTDGGMTWYIPNGGQGGAGKIFFINETTGWAIRSNFIYKTTDRGENWFVQFTAPSSIGFKGIRFVDSLYGWTANLGGRPYKTTNGGNNWIQQINTNIWLSDDVYFYNYLKGWIIEGNKLYYTVDGGNEWIQDPQIYTYSRNFETISNNHFIITGTNIYESVDTGQVWQNITEQVGSYFTALHAPKIYLAYGVGPLGYIIRYIDTSLIPVELINFSAEQIENKILLKWITATETNNSGFQIERQEAKKSRIEDWKNIGFVNGNGTTTEPRSYSFVDENLSAGKYQYRLKQTDFDGSFEYSNTIEVEISIPTRFSLNQNFPNPFNPSTIIKYSLKDDGRVSLKIFNSLGEEVRTLVNEIKPAGNYEVEFNASELPSGIYIYSIQAGEFISSKKMILLK